MSFLSQWLHQLDFSSLVSTLITAAAAVLCITLHELCHGLAALLMGDPTAKRAGRLSLNPLRHVDVFGLVMLTFFKFGWARPVPVDDRNFRNPRLGMAMTALAGPLSNVVLAFAALILWVPCLFLADLHEGWIYAAMFFQYTALLSTGLAVFNLLPIPPLDGSKILFALLPQRAYGFLLRVERYGMLLLMVLLVTDVLDTPLSYFRGGLLRLLFSAVDTLYSPLFSLFFN